VAAPVRKDEPVQSVASGPASVPQPADSDLPVRQYTPADVPDSKQPDPPESRQSFGNNMLDPDTTPETKFAQLREQRAYLTTGMGLDKLKPPIRSPKVAAKTHNSASNPTPSTGDCLRAAQNQRRGGFPTRAGGAGARAEPSTRRGFAFADRECTCGPRRSQPRPSLTPAGAFPIL
jgi:hypothetical protein